ncbi:MAG: hypothetical protein D6760_09220 [Deltaproteobacteria bacterium]|nr:MAG: hypothetical protein D6760_09220 [Deltaproteobacteria bacterium]
MKAGLRPRVAQFFARPLRLRTRIALSFIAVLALWTIVGAASLQYVLSQTAHRFVRERGVETTRALTVECVPLVYYEDLTGLARLLEKQMRSVPDIRYVLVLGDTGNLIYSTFPRGVPADLLAVHHPETAVGEVSSLLIRADGELMYDYLARERGVRVRLGLSLAPAQRLIHETFNAVLRWGGAIGLAAVFGIAFYISRPVESLSQAIEKAVVLDRRTGEVQSEEPAAHSWGTVETTAIADRFQQLMERLEERTRQLDASKKLAYLGEISTSIAHEVNNPLGVIVMNAGFLAKRAQRGELPPDAVIEVERLSAAAARSTRAVQKLLDFARYSTGRAPAAYEPVDVRRLIEETTALLQDRIVGARCRLEIDSADDIPLLYCDEQGLHQVLFNLLTNALDASSEGGVVRISVVWDGHILALEVTDEGVGMDPDTLEKAREPFFTTKNPGQGTGLGLAISESIVRRHGGRMHIKSAVGRGTSVRVEIPIERQA